MILPAETKNLDKVVKAIYELQQKKIEFAFEEEKLLEWIKVKSEELEFDFLPFL